jgi:hypothetical protein
MNKYQLTVIATALLVATQANAVDLGHGINFTAFGTFGLAYSDNDGADYVTNTNMQAIGAGRSDAVSYKVDSKLGAQFDWQASEKISLSTQFLTKQYEDKTWTPRIEVGFLKYEVAPELDVRVGRLRPPVFNLSDFLDVNFANPWVRPPVEHYAPVPFTYLDGGDLMWRAQSGEVSWLIQPYFGQGEVDNAWGNTNDAEVYGINVRGGQGDFTFRAGYALNPFQVTGTTISPVLAALQELCQIDPVACDLVDEIDSDDSEATYFSLGGSWDNGKFFVSGEWSKTELNVDFFPEMQSWYLSGGARFESWTPYITYAQGKDSSSYYTGSTNPFTNRIINGMHNGVMQGQHSISLGVRYDFMPNVALKAQWDHIETECRDSQPDTCAGVFANMSSGFSNEPQEAEVISLSIDFIY